MIKLLNIRYNYAFGYNKVIILIFDLLLKIKVQAKVDNIYCWPI